MIDLEELIIKSERLLKACSPDGLDLYRKEFESGEPLEGFIELWIDRKEFLTAYFELERLVQPRS